MHERYQDKTIRALWAIVVILKSWQRVELAVLRARCELGEISQEIFLVMERALLGCPIDVELWRELDRKLHHDLEAAVEERRRCLPA